jgi:hypothetical protein
VAPVKGSADAQALPSASISEIVEKAAHDNNVDPLLVHSIIQVESNYNPDAVSPKGALRPEYVILSICRTYIKTIAWHWRLIMPVRRRYRNTNGFRRIPKLRIM